MALCPNNNIILEKRGKGGRPRSWVPIVKPLGSSQPKVQEPLVVAIMAHPSPPPTIYFKICHYNTLPSPLRPPSHPNHHVYSIFQKIYKSTITIYMSFANIFLFPSTQTIIRLLANKCILQNMKFSHSKIVYYKMLW